MYGGRPDFELMVYGKIRKNFEMFKILSSSIVLLMFI